MNLREPLGSRTRVKSVMRPFPYTVEATDSVAVAKRMMADHDIRHLPVKEGSLLVGVVSDGDLAGGRDALVREVMSGRPHQVELTEHLGPVVLEMAEHHVDCMLVVKQGRLAGILTATDACRLLGEHLELLATEPNDIA